MSYSLEIIGGCTDEPLRPVGAYLLFVQWKRFGEQGVQGHVESEFLAWGETIGQAEAELGALPLAEAQRVLDSLLLARESQQSGRRWWNVARDDEGGE